MGSKKRRDNLSRAQRSYCMSRVKSKDTELEVAVTRAVRSRGLRFRKHVAKLPGRPDLVFPGAKVVVFIDGDYWHGWQFPRWKKRLTQFWKNKIEGNRRRDTRNFRKLRRNGWRVIRIWQHQVRKSIPNCADRIEYAVHHKRTSG